jgi:Domain of unknown function (DUF4381)
MADAAVTLDASTRAALQKLADISVPQPVTWIPQTWAWAVLAIAVMALLGWAIARRLQRYAANHYRREGLSELDGLEARLADDGARGEALAALPELLKRVALAAWPRTEVASLSGKSWIAFLRAHAGKADFPVAATGLLDDIEYRASRPVMDAEEARHVTSAVRNWIEDHVVSA